MTNEIKDGGPAFPSRVVYVAANQHAYREASDAQMFARDAYEVADAMLKAREHHD